MTVTIEPPVTTAPAERRRRVRPSVVAVCVVAAVAAVAVGMRVLRDDRATVPDAFDAVWLELGDRERPDARVIRVAAQRFPHDPVYFEGHVTAAFEDDYADLARDGKHFALLPTGMELRLMTLPAPDVRLVTVPKDASYPVWSPDLKTIALGSTALPSRAFYLVDVATGAVRTVPYPHGRQRLSWSPDGTMLAITVEKGIDVVRLDGTRVRHLAGYHLPGTHVWSPDGKSLVVNAHGRGHVTFLVDAVTGRETARMPFVRHDIVWGPDGSFVHGDTHAVRYFDARDHVVRFEPTGYAGTHHAAKAFAVRPAV